MGMICLAEAALTAAKIRILTTLKEMILGRREILLEFLCCVIRMLEGSLNLCNLPLDNRLLIRLLKLPENWSYSCRCQLSSSVSIDSTRLLGCKDLELFVREVFKLMLHLVVEILGGRNQSSVEVFLLLRSVSGGELSFRLRVRQESVLISLLLLSIVQIDRVP